MSYVLRPGTVIPASLTHPNADFFSHEVWDGFGKNADYCGRTRPAGRLSATASVSGLPGAGQISADHRARVTLAGTNLLGNSRMGQGSGLRSIGFNASAGLVEQSGIWRRKRPNISGRRPGHCSKASPGRRHLHQSARPLTYWRFAAQKKAAEARSGEGEKCRQTRFLQEAEHYPGHHRRREPQYGGQHSGSGDYRQYGPNWKIGHRIVSTLHKRSGYEATVSNPSLHTLIG